MANDATAPLPDLLRFDNGQRVRDAADWEPRRAEILRSVRDIEYGGMPPAPPATQAEELHSHPVARLLGARHVQYHIVTGSDRACQFLLDVLVPAGQGPFPVILNGDGCWRYVTDEIALEVLRRGYVLAQFTRTEIVPDHDRLGRSTGLYRVYPDHGFGALAAWAWGIPPLRRCTDHDGLRGCPRTSRWSAIRAAEKHPCWPAPPTRASP